MKGKLFVLALGAVFALAASVGAVPIGSSSFGPGATVVGFEGIVDNGYGSPDVLTIGNATFSGGAVVTNGVSVTTNLSNSGVNSYLDILDGALDQGVRVTFATAVAKVGTFWLNSGGGNLVLQGYDASGTYLGSAVNATSDAGTRTTGAGTFPTGFIGIGESGNIIKSVIIVGATNGTPPKFIIDDFVYESLNPPPPPPPSNPVPEPTTMLLLSGGLLGLAALRRKSA